jgi:enoyl-CoA hydratase/carnithine racemase
MTVTIRPTDNQGRMSVEIARELTALAERVEDDDTIAMLTITGEGAVFCRGFVDGVDGRVVESIAAIGKPTVALLNGDAIDEGLELALACDIRISSSRARFALTQIKRGQIPHCGGTQRLARIAGPGPALKMILTGERIDAAEALRIGLVSAVAASRAALDRAGDELRVAIGSRAPIATRLAKEAIRNGVDMTLAQGIRLEEDLYALLQTTADRAEGVRAFLEKRRPLFKGA